MRKTGLIAIPLFVAFSLVYLSSSIGEFTISARNLQTSNVFFPVINTLFEIDVQPFAGGIASPAEITDIVDPGDGRLFVVIKEGRILVVDGSGNISDQLLLDLRDKVYASSFETGMLGLAVHPDFLNNGNIYVYYNQVIDGQLYSDVSRFTVSESGSVDLQSEVNLIRLKEPYYIHQAGGLEFGPDGYLYISTGDGGTPFDQAGNSQSLQSLHGKILRVDINQGDPYAIPPDNPFASDPQALGEIWVYGLRNPWRFSFDSRSGDMYIADVGDANWEEIDFIPAGDPGGQNFGWPCFEGENFFVKDVCDSTVNYTMPIFTYSHTQDVHHCSVTGGYVYHGGQLPELEGKYLFADLCAGSIWTLTPDGQSKWLSKRWGLFTQNWSSIGQRSDGELFLGSINDNVLFQLTRRK